MAATPNPLLERDELVNDRRVSLGSTKHGLGTVPNIIKVIVRDEMWRDRVLRMTGERVQFSSFAEFVTAQPLEGLGATIDQLRGICRSDPEALDAIDRATQNPPSVHVDAVSNINSRPAGTSSAAALRRLRKDRPDLHAAVLAGEISPHGAMVEAGFRPRTVTVPLTVDGATRLLLRLSDDERRAVLTRLMGAE